MAGKKVAVIGAGASGLTALKVCLEYDFDVWCFERSHDIGGLWRFKPEECGDDEGSVMKTTVINTSKEMMAFSDFPPSEEYANFMHNRSVMEYFWDYVNHFRLKDRIRFGVEIVSIRRADDYDQSGQWVIHWKTQDTSATELFDAVLVCTGHHGTPHMAKLEGMEKFKGQILHSHSYKDHRGFEDKRILVVGVGNSGGDVAVELSRVANQVYLVARRGTWVLNRVFDQGKPIDMAVNTRFSNGLLRRFPGLASFYLEYKLNSRFDHKLLGLQPEHGVFQQHAFVNDDLPNRILCGSVKVKPGVRTMSANGAEFVDGTKVTDLDAIVLCTGYSFSFPLLEEGRLIPVTENRVDLYKNMYAANLTRPETLAVIGLVQPSGAIMPIAEMQCRLFCEVLSGRISLPSRQGMRDNIAERAAALRRQFVDSRRHTIQVDYIQFTDQLAEMIGAKPNVIDYLTDPSLALALLFGPCVPYQYRLNGPHAWPGARKAILTVWDRAWYPTKKRPIEGDRSTCRRCFCPKKLAAILAFVLMVVIFWIAFF